MRWSLAFSAVLLLLCCATPRRYRHVYVPKQPESAKCWRECKGIEATCQNRPPPTNTRWTNIDEFCADQRMDCLVSCPGAVEEWRTEGGPTAKKQRVEPNDDGS